MKLNNIIKILVIIILSIVAIGMLFSMAFGVYMALTVPVF